MTHLWMLMFWSGSLPETMDTVHFECANSFSPRKQSGQPFENSGTLPKTGNCLPRWGEHVPVRTSLSRLSILGLCPDSKLESSNEDLTVLICGRPKIGETTPVSFDQDVSHLSDHPLLNIWHSRHDARPFNVPLRLLRWNTLSRFR